MKLSELTGLCYLGTPYTKYPDGIEAAFKEASRIAAKLLLAGVKVYSPIAHTHPIALYGKLDQLDLNIWLPFDEAMMHACGALIVAEMTGWEESKGLAHEIEFFERHGKPVFHLNPTTMGVWRRAPKGWA